MKWDQIKGNWSPWKGSARAQWGESSDVELQVAKGEREQLVGLIQKKYGKARQEAEEEVDRWQAKLRAA